MLGRKNGKGSLVLFISMIFAIQSFSQGLGFEIKIKGGAGYPLNLERDIHKLLTDSMHLERNLSYSYSLGTELEFADRWVAGGGMQFNIFDYKNDSIFVRLMQQVGYMSFGYDWKLNEKLSLKNSIIIGMTQLRQTGQYSNSEDDIYDSYKTNAQNTYFKVSGIDFMLGHSIYLNYALGRKTYVYLNFLYSFNRSRSQSIHQQPVFRNIATPSIGFIFSLSKDR